MDFVRKTIIVVPCYNEASRLNASAFVSAADDNPNLYFLFVNDGSTDNTLEMLYSLREVNTVQFDVLNLDTNCGKAEAVRRGVLKATGGLFDNVGYWDADLATPLNVIDEFCQLLDCQDVDLVMGSRVRLLGRMVERRALRHYLGRIFATCASIMLNIRVYDTQCGAKIFRNSAELKKVFGKPFKVSWTFDVEMLARFSIVMDTTPSAIAARWVECPLKQWVDVKGSKVKGRDYFKGGFEFYLLSFYLRSPARALYKKYLLT